MVVGIDYTSAATQHAGIGRVTRELVRAMVVLPQRPELRLLYAHRGPIRAADALAIHERVSVRRVPVSPRIALAVWQRVRLPLPVEALLGPLHVFHGPDFTLPPRIAAAGVVTIHDLSFASRPRDAHPAQRRFLEEAVPRAIDRARLIVAVSETTKRELMLRFGVRPHRIRVVPNAVARDFRPVRDAPVLEQVRRRLRLPDEFILNVGTIQPRKNLGGLAASAAIVSSRRGRQLTVIHVGVEGWLSERVYADVEAAGARGFRFVGAVDDATLRALYTLATALVYPSLAEGSALTVLEAFACRCPVITSNTGGMAEIAGDAAILVDAADPEALARDIMQVLESRQRRDELRAAGEVRQQAYSWITSARAMLDVYARAVRDECRPIQARGFE